MAFCPTKPAVCAAGTGARPASSVTHLSASQQVAGDIHLVFAATTFVMLGLMALRFAKQEDPASLRRPAVFAFGISWFVKGRAIQGIRARIRKAAPVTIPVAAIRGLEDHR